MSDTMPEIIVARVATPGAYPCRGCGCSGPAAIVVYGGGGATPYALCPVCAGDRARLTALVRHARALPPADPPVC